MLRDLLSSRLIQGGFVFFLFLIGISLFYSWHARRATGGKNLCTRSPAAEFRFRRVLHGIEKT